MRAWAVLASGAPFERIEMLIPEPTGIELSVLLALGDGAVVILDVGSEERRAGHAAGATHGVDGIGTDVAGAFRKNDALSNGRKSAQVTRQARHAGT